MNPLQSTAMRRLNQLLFYLLFLIVIGLTGWLSTRFDQQWDWTAGGRNTLSETSRQLLTRLEGHLQIEAFAQDNALLRQPIREWVDRYRQYSSQVELKFTDPDREPELARNLGVTTPGTLVLHYQGRSELVAEVNEEAITNAIQRLSLQNDRWVAFISGHGERRSDGEANHDLGAFGRELTRKGYKLNPLNLTETTQVPDNTSLLVIAGPRADYLPGELDLIQRYLDQGGNLFWLADPGPQFGLETLAQKLGITFLPGTIVDVNAFSLGIKDPAVALITEYPDHPAVGALEQISLFPHALALESQSKEPWQATPLLQTLSRTWNETGPIAGEIAPDVNSGEKTGPLTIAYLLSRDINSKQQRVLVTGDGDFLSNAYLGNGANLNLGINLVRWLTGDEKLLDIPARTAPDLSLELPPLLGGVMALVQLILLPLGLFSAGFLVWWRRRNL